MKYSVKLQVYPISTKGYEFELRNLDYEVACELYKQLKSQIPVDWEFSHACKGEIRHCDYAALLYQQGALQLQSQQ